MEMRRSSLLWVCGVLIAFAAEAHAQSAPPAAQPSTTPATEPQWYGWQILAADAGALAIGLGVGAASGDHDDRRFGDVVGSAWGLGMLGSLTIHAAHQNSGLAVSSLGYHTLVPPLIAVVGLGMGCLFTRIADNCASDSARWGFALGALGTAAFDVALAEDQLGREPRHWYGWQTLIIDGVSFGAGVVVIASRDPDGRRPRIGGLGAFPYLTGLLISPWVHAFHGRWGTALGSLALRAFAPALGALAGLTGYCAATGGHDRCTGDGAAYGFFAGTVLTAAIDIGLMSHEKIEPQSARGAASSVVPFAMPHGDGIRAGLVAMF